MLSVGGSWLDDDEIERFELDEDESVRSLAAVEWLKVDEFEVRVKGN